MMARTTTRDRRQVVVAAGAVIPGAILAIAAWIGGEPVLAITLGFLYAPLGVAAYLWSGGQGRVGAMMGVDGDERQRLNYTRAMVVTGWVLLVFCLGGIAVDVARGGSGRPFGLIVAVGGATFSVSLAIIRRQEAAGR